MLLGFSRPANRSSGIWCVATSAEASEGEEAEELPRIKLPSCEAAAAMEMATKERTSFMMMTIMSILCVFAGQFVVAMIGLLLYGKALYVWSCVAPNPKIYDVLCNFFMSSRQLLITSKYI